MFAGFIQIKKGRFDYFTTNTLKEALKGKWGALSTGQTAYARAGVNEGFVLPRSLFSLYSHGFASPEGGGRWRVEVASPLDSAQNTNCIKVGSIQTRLGMDIDKPQPPNSTQYPI